MQLLGYRVKNPKGLDKQPRTGDKIATKTLLKGDPHYDSRKIQTIGRSNINKTIYQFYSALSRLKRFLPQDETPFSLIDPAAPHYAQSRAAVKNMFNRLFSSVSILVSPPLALLAFLLGRVTLALSHLIYPSS